MHLALRQPSGLLLLIPSGREMAARLGSSVDRVRILGICTLLPASSGCQSRALVSYHRSPSSLEHPLPPSRSIGFNQKLRQITSHVRYNRCTSSTFGFSLSVHIKNKDEFSCDVATMHSDPDHTFLGLSRSANGPDGLSNRKKSSQNSFQLQISTENGVQSKRETATFSTLGPAVVAATGQSFENSSLLLFPLYI